DALVVVADGREPRLDVGDARGIDPGDSELGLDLRVDLRRGFAVGAVALELAGEPDEVHRERARVLGADGEAEPPSPADHAVHRFTDEAPLGRAQLARAAEHARDDGGGLIPIARRGRKDLGGAAPYLAVASGDGDGDAVRRVSGR